MHYDKNIPRSSDTIRTKVWTVLFGACFPWFVLSEGLAQTMVLKVAGPLDSASAPSANPLPGFRGSAREQILIGEPRLAGLKGKKIVGIQFRRDLDRPGFLKGGKIDMQVSLSTSVVAPGEAAEVFSVNAPMASQSNVFTGTVSVPDSPPLSLNRNVWSALDTVTIAFSQKFVYAGDTLCVDISGVPQKPGEPFEWYPDHEYLASGGTSDTYGSSCSNYSAKGTSLTASSNGLQIGGSIRVLAFGRPGASPMLLLGVNRIRSGIDLSVLGATGCRQYVDSFVTVPLRYQTYPYMSQAIANFMLQVPPSRALIGASIYLQSADIETRLSNWTNPAGFTTSNGLELNLSSAVPSLGMSVVRSHEVDIGAPLPDRGMVEVERAPVIRILYEN